MASYDKAVYRVFTLLIAIVVVCTIADLGYLMSKMLTQWQLMEPAENENLVLTWALANNYANSAGGLLGHGILPIYPDLYHRLSAMLPFSVQMSGRLLTIVMYVGTMACVALYAQRRTQSWLVAGLFSILLFGHPTHSVYFLMQRVDVFYICMGTLSLILVWWDFSGEDRLSQNVDDLKLWRCMCSGVALGCALLSKQTAILFVGLHILPFILSWLLGFRFHGVRQLFSIGVSASVVVGLYWLLINRAVLDDFMLGLSIFGAHPWTLGILHQAMKMHEGYVFIDDGYFYYVLAFLFAVGASWRSYTYGQLCLGLAICALVGVLTLRMWLNGAAFFNNFIFISLFGVLLTLYFWPRENLVKRSLIVIPLLACAIFSYVGVKTADLKAMLHFQPRMLGDHIDETFKNGSYRYVFAETLARSSGSDSILTYIRENPGAYLSTRLDNYLINANREVEFEGSVMGMFTYDHMDIAKYTKNEAVRTGVAMLGKQLHEKIRNQYFQGVLLGLSTENFLKEFPEFLTYYKLHDSRRIVQGNSEFNALLYTKKNDQK